MANYSVNQVHQLYVAKGYSETINDASAVGTLGNLKKIEDVLGDQIMFLYKGASSVLRSDLIQIENIGYAKPVAAADMVIPMKKLKVSLKADVNGGNVVSGQDYVLSINFKNFFSSGDASQYYKDAAVHGTSSMTATQFYAAMVDSLNYAFSREPDANKTSNPYLKFTSDANGLYIEEKPQEWELGTKKARRIMFDVFCSTIFTGGEDLIWGEVTDQTPAKANVVVGTNGVGNGQQIADLEWFCMGERGDQYRNVGWPNVIPTKYLVDPTQQYHVLELHYAFTDTGVNSYRTEKEITIVAPATADGKTALNDFIDALETATGLTIAGIA
jgi:hypothetical protein